MHVAVVVDPARLRRACSTSCGRTAARCRRRRAFALAQRRRSRTPPRTTARSPTGSPRATPTARRRRFPQSLSICSSTSCRTCATARTRTSARRSTATPRRAPGTLADATGSSRARSSRTTTSPTPTRRGNASRRSTSRRASSSSTPIRAASRSRRAPLDAYRSAFATDPDLGVRRHHRLQPRRSTPRRSRRSAEQFVEVLIAPGFAADALAVIARKKNVRVLAVAAAATRRDDACDFKRVGGGLLVQTADTRDVDAADLQVVTQACADAGAAGRPAVRLARRQVRQVERDRLLRATARRSASAPAR